MQALRRVVLTNVLKNTNKSNLLMKSNVKSILSSMSSLSERERGEESKYIQQEDRRKIAELKAQMEKILSDSSKETKEELIDLIESTKPAGESFIEKHKLNSPLLLLPVSTFVLTPLFSHNYLVVNEEFYVLIAFGIFFSTIINNFGPAISKSLDDKIEGIKTSLAIVEDVFKQKLISEVTVSKSVVGIDNVVKDVHGLIDDLAVLQASSLTHELEYKYRAAIAKKLDNLVTLENAAVIALKNRAVTEVRAKVLTTFKEDKKVKEAVLNQAISVLTAGANAKLGKDIVGEVFISSLKSYRENYAKQTPGSDKIINELEINIASVLQPPVIEEKGGNVYETNPVFQKFI
eukprot:gene22150-28681_t